VPVPSEARKSKFWLGPLRLRVSARVPGQPGSNADPPGPAASLYDECGRRHRGLPVRGGIGRGAFATWGINGARAASRWERMRASTNNGSGSVGVEPLGGTSADDCDCRVSAGVTRFSWGLLTGGWSLRPGRETETRSSDKRRFVAEVDAFFGLDFTVRCLRVVADEAFPLRPGLVRDGARLEPADVVAFRVFFAAGFLDGPRLFAPATFPTARFFDEDFPWDFDFRAVDFEETGVRDDFILQQYPPRERSSLSAHRTRCTVRPRRPSKFKSTKRNTDRAMYFPRRLAASCG
jgi:hypothetical protein